MKKRNWDIQSIADLITEDPCVLNESPVEPGKEVGTDVEVEKLRHMIDNQVSGLKAHLGGFIKQAERFVGFTSDVYSSRVSGYKSAYKKEDAVKKLRELGRLIKAVSDARQCIKDFSLEIAQRPPKNVQIRGEDDPEYEGPERREP